MIYNSKLKQFRVKYIKDIMLEAIQVLRNTFFLEIQHLPTPL